MRESDVKVKIVCVVAMLGWGCAPAPRIEAARAPSVESTPARPEPPMATCEKGTRGAAGVTLECGSYAVFYGDVNRGVAPQAQRDRVDEALKRQHGEAYRVERGTFELGRESLPMLRYVLVEGRKEEVKLEGAHVFQQAGVGSRALMCAGSPGTRDECDEALDAMALGGLPSALEPPRQEALLPKMFGEPIMVPSGCSATSGEVRCGDATLSFQEISGDEVDAFEAAYVDEVERELGRASGKEVKREQKECALLEGAARCEVMVSGDGVVWVGVSERPGNRGVVTCTYPRGRATRAKLPEVCAKVLNPL